MSKKSSIIEHIMANRQEVQSENTEHVNSLKREINFQNFFIDYDKDGFTEKETFLREISELSKYDLEKLELFLQQISNSKKLRISALPELNHSNGRTYHHVSLMSENGSRGYKLPVITGIESLIDTYLENHSTISLTLADLYEMATDQK